jgi:hypothetical protein
MKFAGHNLIREIASNMLTLLRKKIKKMKQREV